MWLDSINPQINEMWRGKWPAGFVEPARYLYDHELVCVLQGEFTLTARAEPHRLQAGQCIIVPPDEHHISETPSGQVTRACIHFDWQSGNVAARQGIVCYHPQRPSPPQLSPVPWGLPEPLAVREFNPHGEFSRLLDALFTRWESSGRTARFLCRGLFLELLIQLFVADVDKPEIGERNRGVQLAYAVKELLDRRTPDAQAGIQDLLETLGFSYAHLARRFHAAYGQSPLSYVNARRLERARLLLNDPRQTVQEAADATGYNDISYFIRSFRRHFGQTPAEYRDSRNQGSRICTPPA